MDESGSTTPDPYLIWWWDLTVVGGMDGFDGGSESVFESMTAGCGCVGVRRDGRSDDRCVMFGENEASDSRRVAV